MAARIYSLAKELKLDSKVLVDICAEAGVTGKGSALASLTDEEVEQIKAYINRGPQTKAAAPAKRAVASPTAPGRVEEPAVIRREDYIAPGATPDRMPVLPSKSVEKPKKATSDEAPKAPARTGPGIKLAPLPTANQPEMEVAASEPAPQKPELRLPVDAMRAGKPGSKPLSEHLRKHENRKRQESTEESLPGLLGKTETPSRGKPVRGKPVAPAAEIPAKDRGRRGRGVVGVPGEAVAEADRALLGGREQRQLNRKKAEPRAREDEESTPTHRRRSAPRVRRTGANTAAPRKTNVTLTLPCTVRTFSEAVGVSAQQIQRQLMTMGTMVNINSEIHHDVAELLAVELGLEVNFKQEQDFADQRLSEIQDREDDASELQPRPPVITFLGHVDHGKTSLLDKIIGINVVAGESGGITQHIRAYQIENNGRLISFVDTPGHEAFTEMRARGANVTDIAVLVVAADDGVMPQTEEAISHARAAGVPIVVALNKIDLPGVNIERIYQQLAANDLLPTEWGGDTEVVKTSATTGIGMDDLLETLLTIAELHDYKANPDRPAHGACLEAELHEGRGVVAKLLVQAGTLKVGDAIVCGGAHGRVKAMYDTLKPSRTHRQAGPSMPVNVTGLDTAPGAGDHFYVLDDIAVARQIAESREQKSRQATLVGVGAKHVTLENLFEQLGLEGEVRTLNMILRADVRGSIEAIMKELTKLEHPEVKIKILQATVGGVTEADVHLADASDAVIIGFNVVPDEGARGLAERKGVQVRRYEIIYKITEDLKAALEGMLKPEQREMEVGRVLVKRTFVISRVGTIAGCQVMSGVVQRSARVRLIRDNRVIGDYAIDSLKREKDDAREVRQGLECGIKLAGFNDLKEGDVLEAYKIEEVARTLS